MEKKASFAIKTSSRQELVDITARIEGIVASSGVRDGICTVFVPHATAAVILNENADPNVGRDLLAALNRAIPQRAGYLHDRVDDNAQAHILAAMLGPSETIPIIGGRLALGTWQAVLLVELDGPRVRRVEVAIVKSLE